MGLMLSRCITYMIVDVIYFIISNFYRKANDLYLSAAVENRFVVCLDNLRHSFQVDLFIAFHSGWTAMVTKSRTPCSRFSTWLYACIVIGMDFG